MTHVIENVFVVIIAQCDVVLVVVAALGDFNVRRALRNRHHRVNKVYVLVVGEFPELIKRQIASVALAGFVASLANSAHVELGRGVKFIVAASRNASAIDALIESVIGTRSAVDDSIRQREIRRGLLQATIQFTFIFAVKAILRHPLCVIERSQIEAIVIEATALFRTKIESAVWAVLNVT